MGFAQVSQPRTDRCGVTGTAGNRKLVLAEDDDNVEVLLPDATRRRIRKDTIEVRRRQDISPMPAGVVKTPDELRDVLAYLLAAGTSIE